MTYKNAAKTVAKKRYARRTALCDVNRLFFARRSYLCGAEPCPHGHANHVFMQRRQQLVLHNTRKTTNFAAGFAASPGGLRQPFAEMRLKTRLYN